MIFVLNKVDLVPLTARWVKVLSAEYPTLAFHSSIENPLERSSDSVAKTIWYLAQDKKQISIGLIGYPNVGKSSVINTLRAKRVCKTAPSPGRLKYGSTLPL